MTSGSDIVTVRPTTETLAKQRLAQFIGVSEKTAGSKALSMYLVVIPPGARAEPHCHKDHETAIYVLSGRVETRYGAKLSKSVINQPGDFVFIPPNLPHEARNLSESEPAQAIVARNDPNEQESVVPYDPTSDTYG